MRKFMLLVLLLIGTNPLYVQSSNRVQARPSPVTRLLKIDGKYQPVRGMNLAWLNGCYGHDFGGHPAPATGKPAQHTTLRRLSVSCRRLCG